MDSATPMRCFHQSAPLKLSRCIPAERDTVEQQIDSVTVGDRRLVTAISLVIRLMTAIPGIPIPSGAMSV